MVVCLSLSDISLHMIISRCIHVATEPHSAPGLIFVDCIEVLHHWLQRTKSIWFQYWPSADAYVKSRLLGCWKRVLWPECSLGKTVSLCPASFCTPRLNLPVMPGIYLLTSYFCIPIPYNEKDIFFLVLVLEGLVGLQRTGQLQLLQHQCLGHRFGLLWCLMEKRVGL